MYSYFSLALQITVKTLAESQEFFFSFLFFFFFNEDLESDAYV